MPAAAVYFRDPDDNLLEYLSMLDEDPQPDVGIVDWSAWSSNSPDSRGYRDTSRMR
jgi:hypothetical protein